MSKYYDINKLNTKINILFVGDDGQVWYADGYVDYQLKEKNKEIERLKQGYCKIKEKCNKGECDCTKEEYNEMCETNMKLELEIERLNKLKERYQLEKEIYKTRNQKAIEFIEKYQIERKVKIGNVKLDKSFVNSQGVIDILKGEDKE